MGVPAIHHTMNSDNVMKRKSGEVILALYTIIGMKYYIIKLY